MISPAPRRRADLLQSELDHHRISIAAHAAGRGIEDALSRMHRSGGSIWAERVDISRQADAGLLEGIEAARQVERNMARVAAIVGTIDARLIRRILGDRVGFEGCAALEGKAGARGTSYVATRFRDALEELAATAKAVGAPTVQVDDRYSTVAGRLRAEIC